MVKQWGLYAGSILTNLGVIMLVSTFGPDPFPYGPPLDPEEGPQPLQSLVAGDLRSLTILSVMGAVAALVMPRLPMVKGPSDVRSYWRAHPREGRFVMQTLLLRLISAAIFGLAATRMTNLLLPQFSAAGGLIAVLVYLASGVILVAYAVAARRPVREARRAQAAAHETSHYVP